MISYVLPTRDRSERLAETLRGLEQLGDHHVVGGAEVLIVDNASERHAAATVKSIIGSSGELRSGVPVRVIRLRENRGAAARNVGVEKSDPSSEWVVMLDDDSWPVAASDLGARQAGGAESRRSPDRRIGSLPVRRSSDGVGFVARLLTRGPDVAAVMADIHLPRKGCREAGGLPEVFIGCGVAIRRSAFLEAGGYDAAFGYYAEEYDLAAKLLVAGCRVEFDRAWRVDHQKDDKHRDMNLICGRLVRNNGWVMQRWAPDAVRREELRGIRRRYRQIAEKEQGVGGFGRGLVELKRTLAAQRRSPMTRPVWDRFTGLAHARSALQAAWRAARFSSAVIVDEGKNANVVRVALAELGVREVGAGTTSQAAPGRATLDRAEAVVIGTMSPGPMLDAVEKWIGQLAIRGTGPRVIAPWIVALEEPLAEAA